MAQISGTQHFCLVSWMGSTHSICRLDLSGSSEAGVVVHIWPHEEGWGIAQPGRGRGPDSPQPNPGGGKVAWGKEERERGCSLALQWKGMDSHNLVLVVGKGMWPHPNQLWGWGRDGGVGCMNLWVWESGRGVVWQGGDHCPTTAKVPDLWRDRRIRCDGSAGHNWPVGWRLSTPGICYYFRKNG